MLALDRAAFVPRVSVQVVQMPAKANSDLSSSSANQVDVSLGLVGVLRGTVGAYSQNKVTGSR